MSTPWNRSSAFSPEQLAVITTATSLAIQNAIRIFEGTVDVSTLSDAQRDEAIRLVAEGVTAEIAKFIEHFKSGVVPTK
jgi:hypothetical protein